MDQKERAKVQTFRCPLLLLKQLWRRGQEAKRHLACQILQPSGGPKKEVPSPSHLEMKHGTRRRTDHGPQLGGRLPGLWWSRSTACTLLRGACLSPVPDAAGLCRCAGRALNVHEFRWVPPLLPKLCPSPKHAEFLQKEGYSSLSTEPLPELHFQSCVCPEEPSFSDSSAQSKCVTLVCTKAWMAAGQGMPIPTCLALG